jgi:pimeloyl-ACP methyl ester carboxylesterase
MTNARGSVRGLTRARASRSGRFVALVNVLIGALVVALAICALAWWLQEHLIFFPQPLASTAHLPARAVPLEVVAADGVKLRGFMLPAARTPAPAIIYFGGNAEEASWILAERRFPPDWTIAAVNYRGYGASEGVPGERALTSDALAIFDALAQRGDVDASAIVAFGRSLGTAVAVSVAAERPVRGVILASPFDSLMAVGRLHYPWLPVSLLLRHRFDAGTLARRNKMPLLVIVGERDAIVPPARSRALLDAWAGPKQWHSIPSANHNDLAMDDAFWTAVDGFLRERAPAR